MVRLQAYFWISGSCMNTNLISCIETAAKSKFCAAANVEYTQGRTSYSNSHTTASTATTGQIRGCSCSRCLAAEYIHSSSFTVIQLDGFGNWTLDYKYSNFESYIITVDIIGFNCIIGCRLFTGCCCFVT